jgi:hypothetical protein
MTPKRKKKQSKRRKDKGKIVHLDKASELVLKRMALDNSSGNVKQKELVDLETQSKQRQDRFWSALKERYQYDTSIKRGQDYLLNYVSSKIPLIIMYADLVGSTEHHIASRQTSYNNQSIFT